MTGGGARVKDETVPGAIIDQVFDLLDDDAPLVALLQVGSTARGYALPGSDYDFMAFYATSQSRASAPQHIEVDGARVTVEEHDVDRFLAEAADYRFNLASLRQLHKLRDGRAHSPLQPEFAPLATVAANSHLDRSVVLAHCSAVAQQYGGMAQPETGRLKHALIGWTELLGTLDAVSRPRAEAYSKPKWLYRTLRGAGAGEALTVLDLLYRPSEQKARRALADLEVYVATSKDTTLPDTTRRLLSTALNDAREAVRHFPNESFPQLRFAAAQYVRLTGGHEGRGYDERPGDLDHAVASDDGTDFGEAHARFLDYYVSVAVRVVADARAAWTTRIGSRRFYTHVLAHYEATELLPYTSEIAVMRMADEVEAFVGRIR